MVLGTWKPQGHKGYLAEVGEGRVLWGAVVEVQVVQVLVTVNGFNKVGKEDRGGYEMRFPCKREQYTRNQNC